jgi:hypothetical protein
MTKKFRAYDTKVIVDTFSQTAQIEQTITNMLESGENVSLSDLPISTLPTSTLYAIVVCYNIMFNMLEEAHLIQDGHVKPSATIH